MNHLAIAVVIKINLFLVLNGSEKYWDDFEFPGGSTDAGESGEHAAIRELWEETGLRI